MQYFPEKTKAHFYLKSVKQYFPEKTNFSQWIQNWQKLINFLETELAL